MLWNQKRDFDFQVHYNFLYKIDNLRQWDLIPAKIYVIFSLLTSHLVTSYLNCIKIIDNCLFIQQNIIMKKFLHFFLIYCRRFSVQIISLKFLWLYFIAVYWFLFVYIFNMYNKIFCYFKQLISLFTWWHTVLQLLP